MKKLFVSNLGDLAEAPRASFYRFLLLGISEEVGRLPNPYPFCQSTFSKSEGKRQHPSALVYLFPSEIKLKGPFSTIQASLKEDTSYTVQLYVASEFSFTFGNILMGSNSEFEKLKKYEAEIKEQKLYPKKLKTSKKSWRTRLLNKQKELIEELKKFSKKSIPNEVQNLQKKIKIKFQQVKEFNQKLISLKKKKFIGIQKLKKKLNLIEKKVNKKINQLEKKKNHQKLEKKIKLQNKYANQIKEWEKKKEIKCGEIEKKIQKMKTRYTNLIQVFKKRQAGKLKKISTNYLSKIQFKLKKLQNKKRNELKKEIKQVHSELKRELIDPNIKIKRELDFLKKRISTKLGNLRIKIGIKNLLKKPKTTKRTNIKNVLNFIKDEQDLFQCVQWTSFLEAIRAKSSLSFVDNLQQAPKVKKKIFHFNQDIFLGEIPLMTDEGTFIVNGVERVVVSQIIRSPGIYFQKEFRSSSTSYIATIISNKGLWTKVIYCFDKRTDDYGGDYLYLKLNDFKKKTKEFAEPEEKDLVKILYEEKNNFPLLTLLQYLGLNVQEIADSSKYPNQLKSILDIYASYCKRKRTKAQWVEDRKTCKKFLRQQHSGCFSLGQCGRYKLNKKFGFNFPKEISSLTAHDFLAIMDGLIELKYFNGVVDDIDDIQNKLIRSVGDLLQLQFRIGLYKAKKEFLLDLKRSIKTKPEIKGYIGTYGEDKQTVDVKRALESMATYREDQKTIDKKMRFGSENWLSFSEDKSTILSCSTNVDELVDSFYELNLALKTAKLSMVKLNPDTITKIIRDFFVTSQLSQYMDQTNPLAELTHKRRISVFGPNGLKRDHISTVIRDIHPSQFGKICPVETPEGQNAGLISSVSMFARINSLGSIETPYFWMKEGTVYSQKTAIYLDPHQESETKVALCDISFPKNSLGKIEAMNLDEFISVKENSLFAVQKIKEVNFLTTSPVQILSLATSLIPFVEHNDANRALMGANMQRQAVPLLYTQKPLVGTGFEANVSLDSGMVIQTYSQGKVKYSSSSLIVIEDNSSQLISYYLKKYVKSNQETATNQRPIVWSKEEVFSGQIIADGPGTNDGELSLGKNLIIAYMPWEGYNYEDAIVINERLLLDDCLTSVHVEELETTVNSGFVTNPSFEKLVNKVRTKNEQFKVRTKDEQFKLFLERRDKITKVRTKNEQFDEQFRVLLERRDKRRDKKRVKLVKKLEEILSFSALKFQKLGKKTKKLKLGKKTKKLKVSLSAQKVVKKKSTSFHMKERVQQNPSLTLPSQKLLRKAAVDQLKVSFTFGKNKITNKRAFAEKCQKPMKKTVAIRGTGSFLTSLKAMSRMVKKLERAFNRFNRFNSFNRKTSFALPVLNKKPKKRQQLIEIREIIERLFKTQSKELQKLAIKLRKKTRNKLQKIAKIRLQKKLGKKPDKNLVRKKEKKLRFKILKKLLKKLIKKVIKKRLKKRIKELVSPDKQRALFKRMNRFSVIKRFQILNHLLKLKKTGKTEKVLFRVVKRFLKGKNNKRVQNKKEAFFTKFTKAPQKMHGRFSSVHRKFLSTQLPLGRQFSDNQLKGLICFCEAELPISKTKALTNTKTKIPLKLKTLSKIKPPSKTKTLKKIKGLKGLKGLKELEKVKIFSKQEILTNLKLLNFSIQEMTRFGLTFSKKEILHFGEKIKKKRAFQLAKKLNFRRRDKKRLHYLLTESVQVLPHGVEKRTKDLPMVSKYSRRHLNNDGIARLGSFVKDGDILVGKYLFPIDQTINPEKKLLNAIYGFTPIIRDTCFRVPKGTQGRIVDIRVVSTSLGSTLEEQSWKEEIQFSIAQIRKVQVGDKLSGRHGNKGIISRILAKQDMPYLPDGTAIDILLNPLGVPSRMNVGQVFECLLGFAASKIGNRLKISPFDEIYGKEASRILTNQKLKQAAIVSKEKWIFNPYHPGKVLLRDGRTGEYFDNPITVGKSYILKLIHLVEDKIHTRSTGPYAMITEQPLAGKSQRGGQRFGEMEVWALEAYGASRTLQELLSIKSDDIDGRNDMYESIAVGKIPKPEPSISETFLTLMRELHCLGLDFSMQKVTNHFSPEIATQEKNIFEDIETRLKLRTLLSTKKQALERRAKSTASLEKEKMTQKKPKKNPEKKKVTKKNSISSIKLEKK